MAAKDAPLILPSETKINHDDELYTYFHKSISAVQAHADHFEHVYARPALGASQAFFDAYPVPATFIAVFVSLSVVPVALIIGLSLLAIASITLMALTTTLILCTTVLLSLLSLLILTLLTTLAASAFLTASGITIYALAALLRSIQAHGARGVALWTDHVAEVVFRFGLGFGCSGSPSSGC